MGEEKLDKIEKAARSAGGLFNGLVNWWDVNLVSWHRTAAIAAAGGTIAVLALAGYGAWHIRFIGNDCQLQELSIPTKP